MYQSGTAVYTYMCMKYVVPGCRMWRQVRLASLPERDVLPATRRAPKSLFVFSECVVSTRLALHKREDAECVAFVGWELYIQKKVVFAN